MLVNLTPNTAEIERRTKVAAGDNPGGVIFKYVPQFDPRWIQETGIYQSNYPFNFTHEEFEEFKGLLEGGETRIALQDMEYDLFAPRYEKSQYGVADNIEQIKEYYKEEVEDPDKKYVITCTPVFQEKENEGKGGGWRWHKWGPYIGKLDSRYEYLDDEDFGPDFKYVICFHIYPVQ